MIAIIGAILYGSPVARTRSGITTPKKMNTRINDFISSTCPCSFKFSPPQDNSLKSTHLNLFGSYFSQDNKCSEEKINDKNPTYEKPETQKSHSCGGAEKPKPYSHQQERSYPYEKVHPN